MFHSATRQLLRSRRRRRTCEFPRSLTVGQLRRRLDDLRLSERIERSLQARGYRVLRDIEVLVKDRIAYLLGNVPSYYLKQIAQAAALTIPELRQIHNQLTVIAPN